MIEPDGTVVSYAELAGRADQIGRGLQALGLRPGDCVAGMLPNSSAALALFFAAMETGLYVVPVNWHLAAAEVAYILGDSGAAAFVADERFAAVATAAADQARDRPRRQVRGRRRSPGSPRCPTWAPAAIGPPGRAHRRAPPWSTRRAPRAAPRACGARSPARTRTPSRPPAPGSSACSAWRRSHGHVHLCCSPLYHTAVLNFATISLQLGHPVVLMDGFDPETTARARRAAPGDPHAHGADAVPAAARAARAGPCRLRRQLACAPRSTAPRRARRRSSGR